MLLLANLPALWLGGVQGLRALYPQGGGRNAVEVYAEDLNRLQPTEFLNDTVIDFYIRYIDSSD